jgi:hypothetical protein
MPSVKSEHSIRRILAHSLQNIPATAASSVAADRALRTLGSPGGTRSADTSESLSAVKREIAFVVNGLLMEAGIPARVAGAALAMAAAVAITWAVVRLVPEKPPVPVYPATGFVTFGRTIPTGAQVYLHPRSGELPDSAVPQGTVAADGSVAFSTFSQAPGVPAGDYVAIVQWYPVGRDGGPGRNALPPKYQSPTVSPLRVSVQPGTNHFPPFHLAP